MSIDTITILFHVKHTNRPGLPGRIRFGIWYPEALCVQLGPTCM